MAREGVTRRQYLVFVVVALAHLWLIVASFRPGSILKSTFGADSSPLLLLHLPAAVPRTQVATTSIGGAPRLPTLEHRVAPMLPAEAIPPTAPSDSLNIAAGVDWSEQQEAVA